jgi:peptidoglycan hydrolase-like protein with peptidoglycan-binding domain
MSHFADRKTNREALQDALQKAKKLGGSPYYAGKIDGDLGPKSADAIRDYRRDHDITPAGAIIDAALLRSLHLGPDLITEPGTLPNSIASILIGYILKGTPAMTFLSGYKTYIIGGALIIVGAISLVGWQIPGVPLDPGAGWPTIMAGIGLITGRTGSKNDVAKAVGNSSL